MSSFCALCAFLSFSSIIISARAQNNSYSHAPSSSLPGGASKPLDPSFAGLGIEPSNLYSFTGGDEPNKLSVNLLQNLANYTGTPPHLRIGGNTQDNMYYVNSFTDFSLQNNPNPTVSTAAFAPDEFIFGPSYFKALERFPTGTPITFGLNMAYEGSDYAARINATASAAQNMLQNVNLTSFEIGNEIDLYLENGFRTGAWDGATYTQQWLDRASIVYSDVLKPNGRPANFFEPACTASTIGTSFGIQQLANDGITVKSNSSTTPYVLQWNQHDYYYYIGVSTYTLTIDHFTDLSTTPTQFASWVEQVGEATNTGYPYVLREMGVVGPIGMAGITDVFAASLWTLNFFLYAATLNISSVQMHMTDNSNASAWQPILVYGNQPFVRPNYYAFAAMAQLIGCGGGIQVAGPGVVGNTAPAGYANRLAVYDTYRDSKLASIVILNTNIVNATQATKPSVTVDLSLPDFANQDLYLSYLTADGADSQHNATWNGISYEQNVDGIPKVVNSTVQTVRIGNDGTASVSVRDSQAVIVNIGKAVGSPNACPVNNQRAPKPSIPAASSTNSAGQADGTQGARTSSSSKNGAASSLLSFSRPTSSCILLSAIALILTGVGM